MASRHRSATVAEALDMTVKVHRPLDSATQGPLFKSRAVQAMNRLSRSREKRRQVGSPGSSVGYSSCELNAAPLNWIKK